MLLSRNAGANTARRCAKCGRIYTHSDHGACPGPSIPARLNKAQLLAFGRSHGVKRLDGGVTNERLREAIRSALACGGKLEAVDPRDWIESQWAGGDFANTKSLQWKRGGGFTGISKYFTKQFDELSDTERPGLRHWGQSLGLKPHSKKPSESYSRFTKRRVARLLKEPAALKDEFEKEYPGYEYIEDYPCEIRYSDVVDGFYLYCRMYRRE